MGAVGRVTVLCGAQGEVWPVRLVDTREAQGYRLAQAVADGNGRTLVAADAPLTGGLCDALVRRGFLHVLVKDGIADDVAPADALLPQTRSLALRTARRALDEVRVGEDLPLEAMRSAVEAILADLCNARDAVLEFSTLRSVSGYTYTHSVNVCVYSLLLARALGYAWSDLRLVGIGALLHDVGKLCCADLCAKEGPLTPDEWVRMREHPVYGFEMLRQHRELHLFVAHIAFQHHERLDGSGYPRGISGDEILPCARVVAVADIYDAVSAHRPYAPARSPAEAMAEVVRMAGSGLDPNVVRAFVGRMAIYPSGTLVLLSDGCIGVVTGQGTSPQTPLVRRLGWADGREILAEDTAVPVNAPLRVARTLARLPPWLEAGLRARPSEEAGAGPAPSDGP